jgi:CheY-like chemotaxis protein
MERSNFKALVVHGTPALRRFTRLALQLMGVEAAEAADGRSALRLLAEREFALVLAGAHLTCLSGLELSAWIKLSGRSSRAILIDGEPPLLETSDGFLVEPFTMEALAEVVQPVLGAWLELPPEPIPEPARREREWTNSSPGRGQLMAW